MADKPTQPIDVDVEHDSQGGVCRASIRFGPHYRVEVSSEDDRTEFVLVYTHHGFRADASDPGGELERIIERVRETDPGLTVD